MSPSLESRQLVRRPLLEPSPLQQYMPGTFRRETHRDLALVALGGAGPEENYVLVHGPVVLSRVIELGEAFFGHGEFSIVVESGPADALVSVLVAQGWTLDEDVPVMLLAPIPERPEPTPGLEVRTVTTDEDFQSFMRISATGSRWVPSLEAATDPNVCLLVGWADGAPVATSRLSCLGAVGEINGVVTNESHRRRGIGTAMTWAAVDQAVMRGCSAIVLTATEMGFRVYQRMGFVSVCNIRTYLRPQARPSETSADPTRAQKDS